MTTAPYLALDFGDRHIGVAISEPETEFIFPRETLEVRDEEEAMVKVIDLVEAIRPLALIVGNPLTLHGDVGHQAAKVEAFVERLRPRLPCPVHLFDERMTSDHGEDHGRAAVRILESYLSQLKWSGSV